MPSTLNAIFYFRIILCSCAILNITVFSFQIAKRYAWLPVLTQISLKSSKWISGIHWRSAVFPGWLYSPRGRWHRRESSRSHRFSSRKFSYKKLLRTEPVNDWKKRKKENKKSLKHSMNKLRKQYWHLKKKKYKYMCVFHACMLGSVFVWMCMGVCLTTGFDWTEENKRELFSNERRIYFVKLLLFKFFSLILTMIVIDTVVTSINSIDLLIVVTCGAKAPFKLLLISVQMQVHSFPMWLLRFFAATNKKYKTKVRQVNDYKSIIDDNDDDNNN